MKKNNKIFNIVINFSTLKSGGGQNVAMNFLSGIYDFYSKDINLYYWVAKGSEPHQFMIENKVENFFVLPRNPIKRIIYEIIFLRFWLNAKSIDLVYSYFGYAWLPKRIKQIVGAADSNLFYPEIDFWNNDKGLSRLKRWFKDKYRILGLKRAYHIIFENEAMMKRAKIIFGFDNTTYIKPSYVYDHNYSYCYPKLNNKSFKGLFLCGWHPNKNILIIPKLIRSFSKAGIDLKISLSTDFDNSLLSNKFQEAIDNLGVRDSINMIGPVPKTKLSYVYSDTDFVFLLSALESFSNNIIESWQFKRYLVISDEEWARSICLDSAIYVSRNSPENIASTIANFIKNKSLRNNIERNANDMLNSYPSIHDRIKMELSLIKKLLCK